MGISERVKELSEEIKKTVEDSGLKEKAKCATMIISDTVEKGKKEFEAKMEESKQKIEKQKMFVEALQNEAKLNVIEAAQVYQSSLFEGLDGEELVEFTDNFYQKLIRIGNANQANNLSFGNNISEKNIDRIKDILEVSFEEELPLICYYGGSKDFWILTTNAIYARIKHYREMEIYTVIIENDNIQNISVDKDEDIFTVNGVKLFKVDENKKKILQKYFNKATEKEFSISKEEISNEIEEQIEAHNIVKIKSNFENDEYFMLLVKGYNNKKPSEWLSCTNRKIILCERHTSDGAEVLTQLGFENIAYIGTEIINDGIPVIGMFRECILEIVVQGNKIKVQGLTIKSAEEIIELVNENKKSIIFKEPIEKSTEPVKLDEISQIEKLAKLKEAGIITESEFESKKKELLARI